LERNSDRKVFGFTHQIMLLRFLVDRIKDEVFSIYFEIFYYLMMGNACEMIWWRPRIKIHISNCKNVI
jgi:hypothetical protein